MSFDGNRIEWESRMKLVLAGLGWAGLGNREDVVSLGDDTEYTR